jgi:hypothetical protein
MEAMRFQFSMARLFVAMAFFCVAAWLFVRADHFYHDIVLEEGIGEEMCEGMRAWAVLAIVGGVCVILRKSILWLAIPVLIVLVYSLLPRVH